LGSYFQSLPAGVNRLLASLNKINGVL